MSGSSNALLDAIANPKQVDVAGAYGTANRLAQGIWANRLAQSQQAAGQAFQNSIGPDGTPNQPQFMQNLKDPAAALSALDASQKGQTLDNETFNTHMKRLTALSNSMGAVSAQNPNGVPLDVANAAVDRELASGQITPQIAQQFKAQLTSDPQQNSRIILQGHIANLTAQEALHASRPSTGTQTGPGGTLQGYQVAPPAAGPGAGAVSSPPQPGAPQGVSPEVAGSKVTWTDGSGTLQQGTFEQYAAEHAAGRAPGEPVNPAAQPLLGGLQGQTDGTAAYLSGKSRYTATPGPAPGVVEAAKDTATQQATMGTALVTRADSVPVNKAAYGNMLTDLAKLDTMGPGTGREATINGILQKLTGYGITMDKSQVAGAESFAKIANMIAAQQLGSLGPTDARQSLAMGANPHLDLSKLGNTQIIHMLQGNEDAINAKAQAWQKWIGSRAQGGLGNSPGTYGTFSSDFNHNFDPRVFQQRYMGAKEIGDLRASMTGPGEAAKFKADTIYAREQGWIK